MTWLRPRAADRRRWEASLRSAILLIVLSACAIPPALGFPSPGPTTPEVGPPTATLPPEPETLVVCLRDEPSSLYLYADLAPEANAILEAVYDGPVDVRAYGVQPVALEKLPTFADGDLRVETAAVGEGDLFYNPESRQPDNLRVGSPYLPDGCGSGDCAETFGGGRVRMDQLVAEFRLLPDLRWSDGQPLRAADSVFSFHVDADVATPSTKYEVDRTYAYEQVDERTVRWTGIPGFRDHSVAGYFWSPLPEHAWGGIAPADLPDSPEARSPLGWGPYQIEEWTPGRHVRLAPNPNYARAGEGLPRFERLIYRFLGAESSSGLDQVSTGECDVLDESVLGAIALAEIGAAAQSGQIALSVAGGPMERLDFRVSAFADGRPSLLADPRTRRALAGCVNRDRLEEELAGGWTSVPSTFLPPDHPDFRAPDEPIGFDPAAAQATLESAGWSDVDATPSTPRRAHSVEGVAEGTELILTLGTTDDGFHAAMVDDLVADLAACGIGLKLRVFSAGDLFAAWPDGPALGGSLDLIVWGWPALDPATCELFSSWQIPGDHNPLGVNASGWADPDFDRSCLVLMSDQAGDPSYEEALVLTQDLLAASSPMLPLFLRPRMIASAPDVCGLQADPSALTVLSELEAARRGEACG
ncbi:MAG: ABC transporter substrate-binding protein [Anaerolineales bacterium]